MENSVYNEPYTNIWTKLWLPMRQQKKQFEYRPLFNFHLRNFLERCVNIMKWEKLPFPQHEIERRLIGLAHVGITKIPTSPNPFDAVQGSPYGVTNYPDMFSQYLWTTPINYGTITIGTNGVVIYNTASHLPLYPTCVYYAILTTHIDLTIQARAINERAGSLIKVPDSKAKESIVSWYKELVNGKTSAVVDSITFEEVEKGIETIELGLKSAYSILDYQQLKKLVLQDFYAEIGIDSANEKRERVITQEIQTGFNKVQFNISDMLEQRKKGAEEISNMFNTEITVEINPEIKVNMIGGANNGQTTINNGE